MPLLRTGNEHHIWVEQTKASAMAKTGSLSKALVTPETQGKYRCHF